MDSVSDGLGIIADPPNGPTSWGIQTGPSSWVDPRPTYWNIEDILPDGVRDPELQGGAEDSLSILEVQAKAQWKAAAALLGTYLNVTDRLCFAGAGSFSCSNPQYNNELDVLIDVTYRNWQNP